MRSLAEPKHFFFGVSTGSGGQSGLSHDLGARGPAGPGLLAGSRESNSQSAIFMFDADNHPHCQVEIKAIRIGDRLALTLKVSGTGPTQVSPKLAEPVARGS